MEILHLYKHMTTFNLFLHIIVILFLCKYNALCDDNIDLSHRGSLSSPSPPLDLSFIGQNISLLPEQLFRLLLDAEYVEARNRALGLNAPPINLFDAINQFAEVSGNGDSEALVQPPVFHPPIQIQRQKLSTQKSGKKKIGGKSIAMVTDLMGKNLSPIKRNDQRANSVEHLLRQLISHQLIKPTLSERGSVTDWLQKLSAYMFKQLRNLIIPTRESGVPSAAASHQQNNLPLPHPPPPPPQLPFTHSVFPPTHLSPFNALYPPANDIHPQESESVYHSFANSAANNLHFINSPQTEQYFDDNDMADVDHINLAPDNHLNSDFLPHQQQQHHHQQHPYNPEEYKVVDDEHSVEDTRQAYVDLPVHTEEEDNRQQYEHQPNTGANHQQHMSRPSYQSYQHQSNQQQLKNSKDSAHTTSSSDVRFEYINTHNYHGKNDNYRYARNNNHYHTNNRDNSNRNSNSNSNANMGHNSHNSELVIPLYTDVRINHQPSNERTHNQHHYQHQPQHIVRSASQLRPIVHNVPQQAIQYIIHDNQIETEECREEPFKPLVTATTESDNEAPQSIQKRLSRKKRYIDFDYSKLQLRRVPIWFPRRSGVDLSSAASSDAIVEIKPRSLFRWRQPMQGWKPIIPPEDERKNIFLKRSGTDSSEEQTSDSWDHDQVESHAYFQWQKMSPEFVETHAKNNKAFIATDEVEVSAEESRTSPNIEVLHNKQQQSSDNNDSNEQKRVQRRVFITEYSKYNKPVKSNDFAENKYAAETLVLDEPQQQSAVINVEDSNLLLQTQNNDTTTVDTTTTTSSDTETITNGNEKQYVVEDVKAVEMKHLPDITKAKSLREISEIPGAVIRPIDPKLTDILLKILNQNQDFSSKRITNAYFLEFPNVPEYRPKHTPKSLSYQHNQQTLGENSEESVVDSKSSDVKLEIDDDDVPMTETDFEYGQQICSDKYSGSYADKRKDCRLYYVCTATTVDTYVCPKGTRFDAINQSCRQYNDVVC